MIQKKLVPKNANFLPIQFKLEYLTDFSSSCFFDDPLGGGGGEYI